MKIPEWDHPLQFVILLYGRTIDEYGGQVGEGYTCISGSGVQGYAHQGHFAAAFKRKFGITPSESLLGKRNILAL
ncbi:transcriptional regulator [Kalymmatonema gypsitolerans NIES-4073]|nr:transcriptional regulator [Scytonema sp. NIES-4073]